jgi:hypothetical protein
MSMLKTTLCLKNEDGTERTNSSFFNFSDYVIMDFQWHKAQKEEGSVRS